LTIIPTGTIHNTELDELHVLDSVSFSNSDPLQLKSGEIVKYSSTQKQYIIDECLHRIYNQHGEKFENVVKLMLDYN
jgi:hypothetical protein